MMSSISSMGMRPMGGAPDAQAMAQVRERMFGKADGNGSGGLDASEFAAVLKSGPMQGSASNSSIDTEGVFKQFDADGSGEISQAEMESGMKEVMSRFQGTVDSFGASGGAFGVTGGTSQVVKQSRDDALQSLIDAISRTYSERSGISGQVSLQA